MINTVWGITQLPFRREVKTLLPQQQHILDIIQIHAQQGGFSVILGEPGVGKTCLREHLQQLGNARETCIVNCSRTLHTYRQILYQLADAFAIEANDKTLENALIKTAFDNVKARKTLYILIDEAHLLEMHTLRKLRLLFDRFPKNHNLVLFGQPELLRTLSMLNNQDIKSRITYSATLKPLSDEDLTDFIHRELTRAQMSTTTFDDGALTLILRHSEGNLRLCRNLCLGSLIEAARDTQKTVTLTHVNHVLVQPHWRSHEQLIKQQVSQQETSR